MDPESCPVFGVHYKSSFVSFVSSRLISSFFLSVTYRGLSNLRRLGNQAALLRLNDHIIKSPQVGQPAVLPPSQCDGPRKNDEQEGRDRAGAARP